MVNSNQTINFVMLFEGTWNKEDENPSVISRLKRDYLLDDSKTQFVFLTPGSGKVGGLVTKVRGGIWGSDWGDIVCAQYKKAQECIRTQNLSLRNVHFYIFGFSRGAYQAKVFVNGLTRFGVDLTPKEFVQQLKTGAQSRSLSQTQKPIVKYVGLFDTVCATAHCPLGLENADIPPGIRVRHALASNEYRSEFAPQLLCNTNRIDREQEWFIGCHSDIGWAYNGPAEDGVLHKIGEFVMSAIDNSNSAYTKTLGKIALAWILAPCSMLRVRPITQELFLPFNTTDFGHLTILFPYIVHDSYKAFTNLGGQTAKRMVGGPIFNATVRGVKTLANSRVFNSAPLIEVRRISGQDRHLTATGTISSISIGTYVNRLLGLDGGFVELPVSVVGKQENHFQQSKEAIHQEIMGLAKSFGHNYSHAYKILHKQDLVVINKWQDTKQIRVRHLSHRAWLLSRIAK